MAANILHFGQDLAQCFPFLTQAGYSIDRYEKVFEFCEALQSGPAHQAVSLSDLEDNVSQIVVQTARTCSPAPVILFTRADAAPLPAGDTPRAGVQESASSDFDLVIPAAAPPWTWIAKVDELIARSRAPVNEWKRLRDNSVRLRREAEAVRSRTHFERRRAALECERNAVIVANAAPPIDRVLTCLACGEEFIFTAGEQVFFRSRSFVNDPKQCRECRSARRSRVSTRSEFAVTCAECGVSTTVPFKPTQGRPVLCRSCFDNSRILIESHSA